MKDMKVWTNGNGISKYNGQDKRKYESKHRAEDGYKVMMARLYEIGEVKITISKERYEELLRIEREMLALEWHGVDNWSGYGEAMDSIYE
jgi:hypothetical protein